MLASISQRSLPGCPFFLPLPFLDPIISSTIGSTIGCTVIDHIVKSGGLEFSKPDAANPDLIALLETWQEGNRRFKHIYLYKTSLTSASGGKESDVPDYLGVAHHEGVVFKHASEGGQEQYLQLDFGSDGLKHATSKAFPHIPNQMPWGGGRGKFKKETIAPEHGHPKRLIRVLEMMEGKCYHALNWNCQSFSDLIWKCFTPWNTAWVPDLWEVFENVIWEHNLLVEGTDDVSKVFNSSLQKVA